VQFRGEAFNVLNHTNFSRVFTAFSPTSTTFGKVRDAGDARIIQLGVKMYF
jgi:hypothetical protein